LSDVAALQDVEVGLDRTVIDLQPRLIGDVADGAADRPRAEQRALRTTQGLDPVQVEQVDVGREQRQRDHRLVEIDPDLLLYPGLVADHLPGRDAADRHLALARAQVLDRQAGDVARQILQRHRAGLLDVGLALGVDRERHVQDRGVALGGRDDQFVDRVGLPGDGDPRQDGGRQGDRRRQGGRGQQRAPAMDYRVHEFLPLIFPAAIGL
jgi:hypothetical protein